MNIAASWSRIFAVMVKEMIQMRRDRLTFAMIIGIPIIQLPEDMVMLQETARRFMRQYS